MTKPLSPETLVYGFVAADDAQVSLDGSSILYTLAKTDAETKKGSSDVWLCDIDGGNARQLTRSGKRNGGARWSPDGGSIAFVSDRAGERKSGIYVMPAGAGGDARELTTHNQGISDLVWSPDGKHIAYSTTFDPENPDEEEPPKDSAPKVRVTRRIDYKQDGRGYLGDKRQHVWIVGVDSGERRRLTEEAVDHGVARWSPDGGTISAIAQNRNGMCSQLVLIDVATGAVKKIGPEEGNVSTYSWSPSGDRIIFAGDERQTFQSDFFIYTVASGQVTRLTDDLQSLPAGGGEFGASEPVWLDDRQVLFHAIRAGGSGVYVIDAEGGSVEPVQTWQAQHNGFSTDAKNRYIVQSRTSMTEVGNLHVFDTETNEGKTITNYNAEVLAEHPPAQWERFDIERNGYTIEAWLLKPADFDPSKQYPAVLDIHGGPNGFYGYAFTPGHQLLATNGFVTVYSNPRGSSSYGREFTQQVTLDWGGEDYQDLMAVIDKVADLPYVDAERTGVTGYSYGGYMTSWIIGQTQRFKAAVCGAPCFNLVSMYGTSDISHHFGELQWGGPPNEAEEYYRKHSPSTYAHRATTPTLIIHGEEDERCPIGQAEEMFIALIKADCEVEFARYPGGAHGFRRNGPPEHREDSWERTLGWFKDHLGEAK